MKTIPVGSTAFPGSCTSTMNKHEAHWRSRCLSSYTYTLQRRAQTDLAAERRAVIYEVRNGVLHSAQYLGGGHVAVIGAHRVVGTSGMGDVGTVEALFRAIERAQAARFQVSVQYHGTYGFPTIITATMPGTRDAGYTYTVTDFRVLK